MKRLILLSIISLLFLFGCSNKEDDEQTATSSQAETVSSEVQKPVGSRDNPVPIGEWITVQEEYQDKLGEQSAEAELKVRLTDITRGEKADKIIEETNRFNDSAPEEMEWLIADIEVEMLKGTEDFPYQLVPGVYATDVKGNEVEQTNYATLEDEDFGIADLFPGGKHKGKVAVYVPKGEEVLLVFNTIKDNAYFALEK